MKYINLTTLIFTIILSVPLSGQETVQDQSHDSEKKDARVSSYSIRFSAGRGRGTWLPPMGAHDDLGITRGAILANVTNEIKGPLPILLNPNQPVSADYNDFSISYRYRNRFRVFYNETVLVKGEKTYPTVKYTYTVHNPENFSEFDHLFFAREYPEDIRTRAGIAYYHPILESFYIGLKAARENQRFTSVMYNVSVFGNQWSDYKQSFAASHDLTGNSAGLGAEWKPLKSLEFLVFSEMIHLNGSLALADLEIVMPSPILKTPGGYALGAGGTDAEFRGFRHKAEIGINLTSWFSLRIGTDIEEGNLSHGMVPYFYTASAEEISASSIGIETSFSGQTFSSRKQSNYLKLEFHINF